MLSFCFSRDQEELFHREKVKTSYVCKKYDWEDSSFVYILDNVCCHPTVVAGPMYINY